MCNALSLLTFWQIGSFCYCIINFNNFCSVCLHLHLPSVAYTKAERQQPQQQCYCFSRSHTHVHTAISPTPTGHHQLSSIVCVLYRSSLVHSRSSLDCCALTNKTCREQDTSVLTCYLIYHIHTYIFIFMCLWFCL